MFKPMLSTRIASSFATGAMGVIGSLWAIIATVYPPTHDADKARFVDVACFIAILTVLAVVFNILADERERKYTEAKLDQVLSHLNAGNRQAIQATSEPQATPGQASLRKAALDLAREMRDFYNSVPPGTIEEEFESAFSQFLNQFWPRLRDIKDRLENVLPPWSVVSSTEWLPTSRDAIKKTFETLEREGLRVKEDVPL